MIILFYYYFFFCRVSAQSLTDGAYTIRINNLKTKEMFDKTYLTFDDYKGNYIIEKNGIVMASQEFSVINSDNVVSINIKMSKTLGNSLTYYYETKKFEYDGEEKKFKKNKNMIDIFLNAILFYAEIDFKDK